MLKSYALTLYRSLVRHRLFSALNILGLAVGMAVFLTLTLATRFELSYDRWIPEAEQTYRVSGVMSMAGRPQEVIALIPGPVLPNLQADFPQIEAGVRLLTNEYAVRRGQQSDYETISFADRSFFDVFDLPLVAGDKGQALAGAAGVVLSETMARKYFGDGDPMGQRLTLTLDGQPRDYVVTGVLGDLPENTHLKLDILAPLDQSALPQSAEYLDVWNATNYATYVRLPDAAAAAMTQALPAFMQRRGGDISDWFGVRLEPLPDLHFNPVQMGEFKSGVDRRFVVMLQIIGLLTLALAVINYVNLSTARAVLRAREVGLRKVFGATRGALIVQFLVEAVIVSLVSAVLAVAIVELTLPLLNSALGSNLKLTYLGGGGVLVLLAPVAVAVGLAAGVYPALVISRFEPAAVLASARAPGGGRGAALVREVLVVAQFTVSIALLICTAVVVAQADFVRRADLGYQREGLIVVEQMGSDALLPRRSAIMEAFRRTPGVEAVTVAGRAPGIPNLGRTEGFTRPGLEAEEVSISWDLVGQDYFRTLGMELAAGRFLQPSNGMDDGVFRVAEGINARDRNVVINEAAARGLEFARPSDALNKVMRSLGGGPAMTIVGVAKDARFGSPRDPVPPLVYVLDSSPQAMLTGSETVIVRYRGDPAGVLDRLRGAWVSIEPAAPFEARTVEAALNPFYQPDERRSRLITLGAIVACLIGCLGLYGLAAFNSERRTREIGVRKVLGASTADVFRLLIGQFLRPVIVANLIAWPLAFVLMREWLNGFDQHIALTPLYFGLATLLALAVALVTVSGQALRVARSDPGTALRYE
jgi:putative ABC transport system permease protein